ncbi:hypothetical protein NT04LM_2256 [Listeria monocytogenes FSL F2-208]|nr:hypothetical protein NT04LM_2256 [Listeria monocytogenes FSL F2-208]
MFAKRNMDIHRGTFITRMVRIYHFYQFLALKICFVVH